MIAECAETSLREFADSRTIGTCSRKGWERLGKAVDDFRIAATVPISVLRTAGNTETHAGGCTKVLVLRVVVVTRRLVLPAHYTWPPHSSGLFFSID